MFIRLAPVVRSQASGLGGCGCGCGGNCGKSRAGMGDWVTDLFGSDSFGKASFDIGIGALAGFGLLVLVAIPFFSPAATERRRKIGSARRDVESAQRKLKEAKRMRRF